MGWEIRASERDEDLNAPFADGLGLDYGAKRVFYNPKVLRHAALHVFASRRTPEFANELRFLGWEYALARRTGMVRAWLASSATYRINHQDAVELRDLGVARLRGFLEMRLNAARRVGLVRGELPLSVRLSPRGVM